LSASTGGTKKSKEFDPEPHLNQERKWHFNVRGYETYPTDMVPSLHSLSSLQFKFGILASCPIIATDFATPLTAGNPRWVVPVALTVLLFLSKTDEAAAISLTKAVCAALRTLTWRFRGPEPSRFCASKLTGGYPYYIVNEQPEL
jgi:hypothetical protein